MWFDKFRQTRVPRGPSSPVALGLGVGLRTLLSQAVPLLVGGADVPATWALAAPLASGPAVGRPGTQRPSSWCCLQPVPRCGPPVQSALGYSLLHGHSCGQFCERNFAFLVLTSLCLPLTHVSPTSFRVSPAPSDAHPPLP